LRRASANSSRDLISKITRAKWTVGVVQVVECLFLPLEGRNKGRKREREGRKEGCWSEHSGSYL
jgi:hypothetical protein